MEQLNTISKAELPALLKKSEKHALKWSIERDDNRSFFKWQVEEGYLSMSVSAKTVKRALMILERLIKQFYDAGFDLTVEQSRHDVPASAFLYDGERVSFRLKEKQVRETTMKYGYPYSVLVPTGKLELEVYAGYFEWKPSKLYADTEYTKLEDKLDDVVPYVKGAIEELKRIHEEEEIERKEEEERARIEQEHEEALEERAQQVMSILDDIRLYHRAQVIRNYCDKVEPLVSSKDYLKKIELARRFADWIDPTIEYDDELSEMYDEEAFWD